VEIWWDRGGERPRWAVPVAVTVAVLLVATVVLFALRHDREGAGAAPPPPSHDPPATFAPPPGTLLPREIDGDPLPMALNGFDAFVALPSGLKVIDTRTGEARAGILVERRVRSGPAPRAPVLVTVDGHLSAVAAFRVEVPGHGTTLGHDAVEIVACHTGEYRKVAGTRIDLPPSLSGSGRLRSAWVVGSGSDTASRPVLVVMTEVGPERRPVTYGVDLAAGRVRWRAEGLAAGAVTGGLAVGGQQAAGGYQLGAVTLGEGRRSWTSGTPAPTVTVWPAGPAAVAGLAVSGGRGERVLSLVDAATGRVLVRRAVGGGVACRFDDRQTTVCTSGTAGSAWAAGFDASSGRLLWELPDATAGRVAPAVSTAWHGVVYGMTENGPVALDARTGGDRPHSPGVAPDLVNAYVGVVAPGVDRPRARAHVATS
jgi:hypothetical protein